jgi:tetratricopeptide (TPR) repeat protein
MKRFVGFMLLIWLLLPAAVYAQQEAPLQRILPGAARLQNVRFEYQGWNNCGPATLTNALSYFGYTDNQLRAANWLKPTGDDKNVSPWQMVEFVNTQVTELPVFALKRYGGTVEIAKALLASGYPVIIEAGYDPEPDRLGWMGHYLLLIGYDDSAGVFITHDSYLGGNMNYAYDYIQEYWQHFNYTYIVLFRAEQQMALMEVLGTDDDEYQNATNALEIARQEAIANNADAFAWFNMGTNFVRLAELERERGNEAVALERYANAAVAYDQARQIGLPWRMLWYQFGPYEAYYHVGRYDDMIALARASLDDGGGDEVEETYYYGGLARQGKGEFERAMNNFNSALQWNPNFTPARIARDTLTAQMNGG